MRKQKIVIRIPMEDEKKRTKAIKIAAGLPGVISVALEGAERDRIVVVGDGIDSVALTAKLRKKLRSAQLLSVTPCLEKKEEKKEEKKDATVAKSVVQPHFPLL